MAIYCLGLLYSLPRFFEYKTVVRREKYTIVGASSNETDYVDYLVVINRLHNSRIYQYSVHLSESRSSFPPH